MSDLKGTVCHGNEFYDVFKVAVCIGCEPDTEEGPLRGEIKRNFCNSNSAVKVCMQVWAHVMFEEWITCFQQIALIFPCLRQSLINKNYVLLEWWHIMFNERKVHVFIPGRIKINYILSMWAYPLPEQVLLQTTFKIFLFCCHTFLLVATLLLEAVLQDLKFNLLKWQHPRLSRLLC